MKHLYPSLQKLRDLFRSDFLKHTGLLQAESCMIKQTFCLLKSAGAPLPPLCPPFFLHLIHSNLSKRKEEISVQQDCFPKFGWCGQLSVWLMKPLSHRGSRVYIIKLCFLVGFYSLHTVPLHIVCWNICRLSGVYAWILVFTLILTVCINIIYHIWKFHWNRCM